jgi:hypothetical protein
MITIPDWAWIALAIVGSLVLKIAGVDTPPFVWCTVRFTPTSDRAYRFWARVHADCDDEDAGILADVRVESEGTTLLPPTRLDTFPGRWWVASINNTCRFTVKLWTSPVLVRGRPVDFHARIRSAEGSPVVEARVSVST